MNDNVCHPRRVAMKDHGARPDKFLPQHRRKRFAKAVIEVEGKIGCDVWPFRGLYPGQKGKMPPRKWKNGKVWHQLFFFWKLNNEFFRLIVNDTCDACLCRPADVVAPTGILPDMINQRMAIYRLPAEVRIAVNREPRATH